VADRADFGSKFGSSINADVYITDKKEYVPLGNDRESREIKKVVAEQISKGEPPIYVYEYVRKHYGDVKLHVWDTARIMDEYEALKRKEIEANDPDRARSE
jgi:hypothetical protein